MGQRLGGGILDCGGGELKMSGPVPRFARWVHMGFPWVLWMDCWAPAAFHIIPIGSELSSTEGTVLLDRCPGYRQCGWM